MALDPERDYPLGSRRPDLVRSPTGRALADLALEGDVSAADLRATPDTLRLQGEVARAPPVELACVSLDDRPELLVDRPLSVGPDR